MRIKLLLLGLFLGILSGWSQTTVENDSTVCIGIEDLRTITKMTEDLKYTKSELEMADSIITHQREIIELKNQTIDLKTQELQDNLRRSMRKEIKIGVISGVAGVIIGVILGAIL